jgi:hypothetical protein
MVKRAKQQPKFGLDMDPDEFLARVMRVKPSEVDALAKRGKKKKPPGTKNVSGGTAQSESVVDLRRRRMRKRETGR